MEDELVKSGSKTLSGENVFKLYDTYGFPVDLTTEILEEKGFSVDEEGFKKAMEVQKQTARNARTETNYMGADATVYDLINTAITSKFVGYDRLVHDSVISVLTTDTMLVDELVEGTEGTIIVDETPFYAAMGGQTADVGAITTADGASFNVVDTIKLKGGRIGHVGVVECGTFRVGGKVTLKVDEAKRAATAKNHSATHLLQEALRVVLGTHVEQAGSLVTPDRLRFDFTHFSAMTKEELDRVEAIVNEKIAENLDVVTQVMNIEDAKKTGAKALFGEKYGLGNVMDNVAEVKGMKFLGVKVADVDMNELRNLGDSLKEKLGTGVVVLASSQGADKVNLIVTATDDAVKKGVHAGNIIKACAAMVGGGGGGRPNMAQAGGKNPAGIDAALEQAKKTLEEQL